MKIVPNYNNNAICYFCGEELADWESSEKCSKELICITKTNLLNYKYTTANIEIPRCKDCEKKHDRASIPHIILFIAAFAFGIWFLMQGKEWTEHWYYFCFGLFLDFMFSAIVSYIIGAPFRWIISAILKCKDEEDTDDYPPIKKLKDIGFRSDKPKANTHPEAEYDETKFRKAINDIIMNDNCVIER